MAPQDLKDLAALGVCLDLSESTTSGPAFLKELMAIVKGAGGHLTVRASGGPAFLRELAAIGRHQLTIKP